MITFTGIGDAHHRNIDCLNEIARLYGGARCLFVIPTAGYADNQ